MVAEQSVIGCLIMFSELLDKAVTLLAAKMFESEQLGLIFNCMKKLKAKNKPIDFVTVISALGDSYKQTLTLCAETAPSVSSFETYCGIVIENWRTRTITGQLQELMLQGCTADEYTKELCDMIKRQQEINSHIRNTSESSFKDVFLETYKSLFEVDTAIKSDWSHFNNMLGGLQRGGLYIIAARPGKGKTDFGLHLATSLAKTYHVDFISLEMTKNQLMQRILSRACSINSVKLRDKKITDNDITRLNFVFERMKELHIIFDDESKIDVSAIEGKIIANKPDIVFIDYLGLLQQTGRGKKEQWEAIGDITKELKQLAKKNNIVIAALVQLNRTVDKGGKPTLADLKGSSSIEADADGVMFICPDTVEYQLSGEDSLPTTVIVAKNRHGATGDLPFHWQPQYHNYIEIDYRRETD